MADILHRVGIKASAATVYEALATRDGLAGWWTIDTKGESKPGDVLKFRFSADGREIGGFDMKVLDLRPAAQVLWQVVEGPAEWLGTKVSFDLKQEGDYCIVLFKRLLTDPRVDWWRKAVLVAVIAYVVSPIDLVPDFIPIAGQLDDAILVVLAIRVLLRGSGPRLLSEHWPGPARSLEFIRRLALLT